MAQKQPTPPYEGGAGNITAVAASAFPDHSLATLRWQFLNSRFGLASSRAKTLADLAWETAHVR